MEEWATAQAEKRVNAEVEAIRGQQRIYEQEMQANAQRQIEQAKQLASFMQAQGFDQKIRGIYSAAGQDIAGLAEKIDREETYHRLHAQMWEERLRDEPRFREAVEELWPYALGLVAEPERNLLCERVGKEPTEAIERGEHTEQLRPLWEEVK